MRTALKFSLVVTVALLGILFRKVVPKRRELPEDHWI
jgi:hypothetical protein